MALTPVILDPNAVPPKDVAYITALGTGNTIGFAFTLITGGSKPVWVQIRGSAAWFWSYQDSQTAAEGTMVPVDAGAWESVQVPPQGMNLYCKVASGTAAMCVVQRA